MNWWDEPVEDESCRSEGGDSREPLPLAESELRNLGAGRNSFSTVPDRLVTVPVLFSKPFSNSPRDSVVLVLVLNIEPVNSDSSDSDRK